jgi:histidine triad (HIT) family protein
VVSEPCVFCEIVEGRVPAFVLAEDDAVIVFLSLENHPLVVPKRHIRDIYALDEASGAAIMRAASAVARAVKAGLACEGITLVQANEAAGGQDVFHFHLHVYPRWRAVEFDAQQVEIESDEAVRRETARKIMMHLRLG